MVDELFELLDKIHFYLQELLEAIKKIFGDVSAVFGDKEQEDVATETEA